MRSISPRSEAVAARLFDGTSARVRIVRVARGDGALLIDDAEATEQVADALLSRDVADGRIVLHRTDRPDWRLAIASADAAAFRDLPGRHRLTPRGARWLAGAVGALALVALIVWSFGNAALLWAAPLVPRRIAAGVGAPYAELLAGGTRGCTAPAGSAALARIVARVTPAEGFVEPVRVRVSRDPGVNAFTLPGGEIVVLSGLIDAADNPDELAGVLAHEFGHVQHRHPAQALIRHFGIDLFVSGIGGNIGSVAATGLFLRNSRAAEREADDAALAILHDARVSPAGLAGFFARVERRHGDSDAFGRLATLAATHPSDSSRQARFRAAARAALPGAPLLSAAEWHALKAICARGSA